MGLLAADLVGNQFFESESRVRPEFTLLAGMPGSGKSHWRRHTVRRRYTVRNALCLDGVARTGVGGREAMESLYGRCSGLLRSGEDVCVDVTAVRSDDRAAWLYTARAHNAWCRIVVFTTPPAVCIARNQQRHAERRVPDEQMAFYVGMHVALPAAVEAEHWDEVVIVDGR